MNSWDTLLLIILMLLIVVALWLAYDKGYGMGTTHQLNLNNAFEQGKVFERVAAACREAGKPEPTMSFHAKNPDDDQEE